MKTIAHFLITGEHLTNFFRDLVLEGKYNKSSKALMEDVHGISWENVIDILSGEKRFIGDSNIGIDLVDEISEVEDKYKKELDFIYGGLYYDVHEDKWFVPYAHVRCLGYEDYKWVSWGNYQRVGSIKSFSFDGVKSFNKSVGEGSGYYRPLYYSDDPYNDRLYYLEHDKEILKVLFKEIRNVPVFVKCYNNPQDSLNIYIKTGKYLEERNCKESIDAIFKEQEDNHDEIIKELDEGIDKIKDQQRQLEKFRDTNILEMTCINKDGDSKIIEIDHSEPEDNDIIYYRKLIINQANSQENGWFEIDGIRIPRAPFERWSLNRTPYLNKAMEWKTICPLGLKMVFDDPVHSDWVIGAGFSIDQYHELKNGDLFTKLWDESFNIQRDKLSFEVYILSGYGKIVYGKIKHYKKDMIIIEDRPIVLVIPFAKPDYYSIVKKVCDFGSAVITREGGEMAHLVNISREEEYLIVRSQEEYKEDSFVTIDGINGKIKVHPNRT